MINRSKSSILSPILKEETGSQNQETKQQPSSIVRKVVIKDSRRVELDDKKYEIRDGRFSVSQETSALIAKTSTPVLEV